MERSRGVDIPRAQQNCPTPKIRKVTARAVVKKNGSFVDRNILGHSKYQQKKVHFLSHFSFERYIAGFKQ